MIYLQLFFTFLKVGAFAFGGGYAMLSLIGDSVLKYGWMTEQELLRRKRRRTYSFRRRASHAGRIFRGASPSGKGSGYFHLR